MIRDKQRGDADEATLVRYLVVYVLVAWATLVIPLLLGHSVLIAVLCATPVGLAGIWFAAWTIFERNDRNGGRHDQPVPVYESRKSD